MKGIKTTVTACCLDSSFLLIYNIYNNRTHAVSDSFERKNENFFKKDKDLLHSVWINPNPSSERETL